LLGAIELRINYRGLKGANAPKDAGSPFASEHLNPLPSNVGDDYQTLQESACAGTEHGVSCGARSASKIIVYAVGLNQDSGRQFKQAEGTENRRDVGTLGDTAVSTATLTPLSQKRIFKRTGKCAVFQDAEDYAILSACSPFPRTGIKKENFVRLRHRVFQPPSPYY